MFISYLFFIIYSSILLSVQYFIGTAPCKKIIKELIGTYLFRSLYRFIYIIITLLIYYLILKIFITLPDLDLLNEFRDGLNNIQFILFDNISFIALIFVLFAIWDMGISEFLGIKQIIFGFLKLKTNWHLDRIRTEYFIPTGSFRRHRHPIFFYMLIALLITPHLSVRNILLAIIFIPYYLLVVGKQYEKNMSNDYGESYTTYQKKTNMFIPGFKTNKT